MHIPEMKKKHIRNMAKNRHDKTKLSKNFHNPLREKVNSHNIWRPPRKNELTPKTIEALE